MNHFIAFISWGGLFFISALFLGGWIDAWIWLLKKTKQIEKTKDRFKYALWRAIFLLTFLLILPVCVLIFNDIFGLLLGLFLNFIGFLYWGRLPFVTHRNDKTFKRRLIISVFLTLACLVLSYLYFSAFATCSKCTVSGSSTDTEFNL